MIKIASMYVFCFALIFQMFFVADASLAVHDCPELRDAALDNLFAEVRRVTNGDAVTLRMMDRFESNLPRVTRWMLKAVLHGKGTRYILQRCAGPDGSITRESARAHPTTCLSKCTYAHAINKFIDWGLAKYWL